MDLRGFSTMNFWADDVAAAVAWYEKLLGVQAYFTRPGPDGAPAYAEFRLGDRQDELGIVARKYAPPGAPTQPCGAVMHWHVDDLEATTQELLSMGAEEYLPITKHGEGFITASVVDPFGNVLGGHVQPALPRHAHRSHHRTHRSAHGLAWRRSSSTTRRPGRPGWPSGTRSAPRPGCGSPRSRQTSRC